MKLQNSASKRKYLRIVFTILFLTFLFQNSFGQNPTNELIGQWSSIDKNNNKINVKFLDKNHIQFMFEGDSITAVFAPDSRENKILIPIQFDKGGKELQMFGRIIIIDANTINLSISYTDKKKEKFVINPLLFKKE